MSTERKTQRDSDEPHMEKQIMNEPQEEFVGDEAQPSKDVSEAKNAGGGAKRET